MTRWGIAVAAGLLLAVPSALLAQSPAPAQRPNVAPIPPVFRPHPHPTGGYRPRPNRSNQYPVVIDGSVVDRYLATPSPAPKHKPTPHPHNNGQDVFETHSTTDNQ